MLFHSSTARAAVPCEGGCLSQKSLHVLRCLSGNLCHRATLQGGHLFTNAHHRRGSRLLALVGDRTIGFQQDVLKGRRPNRFLVHSAVCESGRSRDKIAALDDRVDKLQRARVPVIQLKGKLGKRRDQEKLFSFSGLAIDPRSATPISKSSISCHVQALPVYGLVAHVWDTVPQYILDRWFEPYVVP